MSRRRVAMLLGALALETGSAACGGNGTNPGQDGGMDAPPPNDGGGGDAVVDAGDDRPSTADADARGTTDAADGGPRDAADGAMCQLPLTQDGTCNSIALAGATIRATCSSAPVPQASGGAIEDGVYVLEAMTFYGTCPAGVAQQRTVWVICGGSWQTVEEVQRISGNPDAGMEILRIGLSVALQPASIMADVGCWYASGSGPARVTWGYSATPGQLALHIPFNPGVRVDSFTRQ